MRTIALISALAAVLATPAAAQMGMSGRIISVDTGSNVFETSGGEARDRISYNGLEPGREHVLVSRLIDAESGRRVSREVTRFTPERARGHVDVTLDVPLNRSKDIRSYVTETSLSRAGTALGIEGYMGTMLGDPRDARRSVVVRSIQEMNLVSVTSGDEGALPATGGRIVLKAEHRHLREGFNYTIFAEALTPAGEETGIHGAIRYFTPESEDGEIELVMEVPEGFDGAELVPIIGLYEADLVTFEKDGSLGLRKGAERAPLVTADTDGGEIIRVAALPEEVGDEGKATEEPAAEEQ